jgi:SAM-dependent methyltransferase
LERAEYLRMQAVEDRMWWFRGLRALSAALMVRALARSLAMGPVLDAGCGTGGMLARLGRSVAGRTTLGIELDRDAAMIARGKADCPVLAGSVIELPLGDATLGGYLSLDVLCHSGVDPDAALAEAHRCLAPGSIALFNLPAYPWLLSAHDRRVHNVRRFTRGPARALLARHGFRVLRSTYWNMLLFPLMLLHRLTERQDAPSDVRLFPGWLDRLFAGALWLERVAIAAGLDLPCGGSLMIVAERDG